MAGVGDDETFGVTGFGEAGGVLVKGLDEVGNALACFCGNGQYLDVRIGNTGLDFVYSRISGMCFFCSGMGGAGVFAINIVRVFSVLDVMAVVFSGSRTGTFGGGGGQEVGFVEGEDDWCVGGIAAEVGDGVADGVGALGDVGHGDDEGGSADGVVGAFDAELFDGVAGLAESGCVHKAEYLAAGQRYGVFDDVAGGAVNVADDGTVIACEGVEQGRFAGVGGADDGGGNTVFDGLTGGETPVERRETGVDVGGELSQPVAGGEGDVFFGEVEFEFDERCQVDELLTQTGDTARYAAFHLAEGYALLGACGGGDEVGYGLGLCEVKSSRHECAACELAGSGKACSGGAERGDDFALDVYRAVDCEFDGILRGERAGSAVDRGHGLVEGLSAVVEHCPEMCGM